MATVLVSVALVAASIWIAIRMESGLDSPAARALPADTGPMRPARCRFSSATTTSAAVSRASPSASAPSTRRCPSRRPGHMTTAAGPSHPGDACRPGAANDERMVMIKTTVDGVFSSEEVEPRLLLVHYLRTRLGRTGTVVGCDTSNCGACTVLLDGMSVKSCTVLALQADGAEITTVQGLADGELHPVQKAFQRITRSNAVTAPRA